MFKYGGEKVGSDDNDVVVTTMTTSQRIRTNISKVESNSGEI
jgi:hypothetical protein